MNIKGTKYHSHVKKFRTTKNFTTLATTMMWQCMIGEEKMIIGPHVSNS